MITQSLSPGRRTVARSPSGHGIAISPNATLLSLACLVLVLDSDLHPQTMIWDVDTLLVRFWGS